MLKQDMNQNWTSNRSSTE